MHLTFEELSLRFGGAGYGSFTGEAELDDYGQAVGIEVEGMAGGTENLKLDIAELLRERVALRRKHGSGFLENEGQDARDHVKKWVLFHALSESLQIRFKEEIDDFLLDQWSGAPSWGAA